MKAKINDIKFWFQDRIYRFGLAVKRSWAITKTISLLAWRNLWRNKRRTLITAASIFFAVFLAIIMRSVQEGVYDKMIENVVSYYTGYVQVHKNGYWDEQSLDNSFVSDNQLGEQILTHRVVDQVVPRLESFALASAGDVTKGCLVVGIDPEEEDQLTSLRNKLENGSYFTSSKEPSAILAVGLAEQLELGVGDTLVLIGQGYQGVTAAGKYLVNGLAKFGSPELNKRMVYLPLETAQQMYNSEGRLTSFALSLNKPQQARLVVNQLRSGLDESYEVMDWEEMMPELVQMIEADRGGGVMFILVLYLIVGFGIFGTILMMTSERKYEFGVMVAIGMKKWRLGFILMIETIIIALMGVLGGSIFALPFVLYFRENPIYLGGEMEKMYAEFGFEAVIPTVLKSEIFIEQALVILIISILIGSYPLWKISGLEPVPAMRN